MCGDPDQRKLIKSIFPAFRSPNGFDLDGNHLSSEQLYMFENDCNRHGQIPDYGVEDIYQSPKDPFDG